MPATSSEYALGSTDSEHERLIRQAVRLKPLTERLFRDAGIGPGQRVLDLGSGVGDVAMLAAGLVGPSGEVMGTERDPRSISRARARVTQAGLNNVSFTECDVSQIQTAVPFDAVVGRFILQFVPDPVAVLRSLSQLLRPGGVVVFQEICYTPMLAICVDLPLWSACLSLAREIVQRAGAKPDMGLALHRSFLDAGLPAPNLRMEMPLGSGADFTRWIYDLLCSLHPQAQKHHISFEALGDLDTLSMRLQSEIAESKTSAPYVAVVGAWSRTP